MRLQNFEASLPLAPEQLALHGTHGEAPAPGVIAIDIAGPLDEERLRDAVGHVAAAHGALRHVIGEAEGYRGLRQWVRAGNAVPVLPWRRVDLRGERGDAPALRRAALDTLCEPAFAPGDDAHLRAALILLDGERATLALAANPWVADGGSLRLLARQVGEALRQGAFPDAEASFQYAQFVEWRQELAAGDDARAGERYWAEFLGDLAALEAPRLALRSDGPAGARVQRSQPLDSVLAARIASMAQARGLAPAQLVQAAWWLLLSRHHRGTRFIGGWQHDCRADYEVTAGTAGVFDKVLPVLVEADGCAGFDEALARIAAMLSAHSEAQEYWQAAAPPTEAHLRVGFEAIEAGQDDPAWRVAEQPAPAACFELAMQFAWGGGNASVALHADAAHYGQDAVDALLRQFGVFLQGLLDNPAAPVADLPLLDADAQAALLTALAPQADLGIGTVPGQVAAHAARTPQAPAVEDGEHRLSHAEFDRRVTQLAQGLRARGAAPGALVALQLPRSLDLVVAIFAVWRTGAGCLPVDPEWPAARREAVLADARPACVLHPVLPPEPAAHDVALEGLEGADGGGEPLAGAAPEGVAYVLYTSGSTGRPKGGVVTHAALFNYVAAASWAMDLASVRRWALTSSVAADLGNTALFGSLFNGACLVVAQPEDMQDAESFARFMRSREIDGLKIVPSHLEALLDSASPVLPARLVLGGEAAPRALLARIARIAPACRVHNHYGPTEATVGVMVHAVTPGAALPELLPLTQVLANNRVRVLDEALRPVAEGQLGQLYLGGAQLARGYLHGVGAEAFIDDPFQPGERLYRTGDLGCLLPGGGIRLAGRADQQVKIRGFRVEPAEIEAALIAQPGVRQAIVLASQDDAGRTRLCACLQADEAAPADTDTLRMRLAALLPAYMQPAAYVWLREIPRLPNGKIDRLALAASVDGAAASPAKASRPPRDALESALAQAMAQLLGRDAVGIDDDFFELGGHSLLVIKLVARIRKQFELQVAPGLVFDHPSVAALAVALRAAAGDAEALEQRARAAPPPLFVA
ncbi:non-ribosomal peptide synthetase [Variovorax sp. WS11]|uniref:non-ribosomal peptide synthetase n=1 Tax=Variovorax sp. WS11 TaxID=1105204 RepID=UPI000D0CD802|nr:non-ribosomal peptide synthetase [Variovorax sp. WS11]NDZ18113.1 amino acid adenylation domain-containing protein [Variovorax sp. WS11]PSL79911.1 non-ribosomal peptide synthetase [Variovorax sp. WS11]